MKPTSKTLKKQGIFRFAIVLTAVAAILGAMVSLPFDTGKAAPGAARRGCAARRAWRSLRREFRAGRPGGCSGTAEGRELLPRRRRLDRAVARLAARSETGLVGRSSSPGCTSRRWLTKSRIANTISMVPPSSAQVAGFARSADEAMAATTSDMPSSQYRRIP